VLLLLQPTGLLPNNLLLLLLLLKPPTAPLRGLPLPAAVLLLLSLLLLLPSLLPKLLCRNGGRLGSGLGSKVALLPLLMLLPAPVPVLGTAAAAAAGGEAPHSSDNAPGGWATGEEPKLWQRRLQARKTNKAHVATNLTCNTNVVACINQTTQPFDTPQHMILHLQSSSGS
jgi:hypothetical protein